MARFREDPHWGYYLGNARPRGKVRLIRNRGRQNHQNYPSANSTPIRTLSRHVRSIRWALSANLFSAPFNPRAKFRSLTRYTQSLANRFRWFAPATPRIIDSFHFSYSNALQFHQSTLNTHLEENCPLSVRLADVDVGFWWGFLRIDVARLDLLACKMFNGNSAT